MEKPPPIVGENKTNSQRESADRGRGWELRPLSIVEIYSTLGHLSANKSPFLLADWNWKPIICNKLSHDQIRSVAQSCPTLCDPMNRGAPGLPVCHQLPEFTQTQVHRVSDAIQPSHPLSSPSPPVPNPSQHQSLCQWVNSSHEVAKELEFQL